MKNGDVLKFYPSSEHDWRGVTCEYITLPGWKTDISKCRTFEELPLNARTYVTKIEETLQVPIWWIGVGQARDAIIFKKPWINSIEITDLLWTFDITILHKNICIHFKMPYGGYVCTKFYVISRIAILCFVPWNIFKPEYDTSFFFVYLLLRRCEN